MQAQQQPMSEDTSQFVASPSVQSGDNDPLFLNSARDNVPGIIGDYVVMQKRPLFNPERKPPALDELQKPGDKSVAKIPEKVVEPDVPELVGILSVGDTQLAYVKGMLDEKPVGLKVGDIHDGWQLTRLGNDKAVVVLDGREQELMLNWKGSARAKPVKPLQKQATIKRKVAGNKKQGNVEDLNEQLAKLKLFEKKGTLRLPPGVREKLQQLQ